MSKEGRPPEKDAPRKRDRRWWPAVVALVLVSAVALYWYHRPTEREPLRDVFETLEDLGYEPNTSLSGSIRPGDVLQVAEPDADSEGRPLPTPILFLRGEDCFPGQAPEEGTLPLPEVEGTSSASLGLEATRLSRVLPGLEAGESVEATYRLKFDRPHRLIHAKGDLSNAFSEACVERLKLAIEAGDRAEWFATVIETVVADGLTFEMEWSSSLSTGARASLELAAQEQVGKLASRAKSGKAPATRAAKVGGEVTVQAKDDRKTVLRAEGPVVVGYKARPLQPVYDEASESPGPGGAS